jgi:hypothetical protein
LKYLTGIFIFSGRFKAQNMALIVICDDRPWQRW